MSALLGLAARLRDLVRPRDSETRMDEEFRFHVDMETEQNVRRGMSRAEARRIALASFGGRDAHREAMRDGRGARWMGDLLADLRYAARVTRRSPGLLLATTITLAAGVGVNGIVFGTINGLLFRTVPAAHPDRLIGLYAVAYPSGRPTNLGYEDFLDYRDKSGIFDGLAAHTGVPLNLQADAGRGGDLVWGEMVSENYFAVIRMQPLLGRFFTNRDAMTGADPSVVLSYDAWRARFNGDRRVIGASIRVNGSPFTVVGVAPKGFKGMRKMAFWPEMWVPLNMRQVIDGGYTLRGRGSGGYVVFGRMRDGWTLERTQAAASTFARSLAARYPDVERGWGAVVVPGSGGAENPGGFPPGVMLLASSLGALAVLLILVIVCANIANLLLARAAARRHELAIRLSLGCSRARLVRQLLVEATVLAVPGLVLGCWASFSTAWIETRFVPHLQFRVGVGATVDAQVLLVTAGVGIAAVVLFALAPALRASRPELVPSLKSSSGGGGMSSEGGGSRGGMRSALVVMQLALSVVLVTGGILFARSLWRERAIQLGFDQTNRVMLSVDPGLQHYDSTRGREFYRDVLARVRAMPGVAAASWGFPTPFDTYGRGTPLYIEGVTESPQQRVVIIESSFVDDGFFATMGMPITAGRDFGAGDSTGAPLRIVVSETMARRYWPGRDPLGQRMRIYSETGPEITVVGVVGDARFTSISAEMRPRAYLPLRQQYTGWETLIVHTRGDPVPFAPRLRAAVASADPMLPAFGLTTMQQAVDNGLNSMETAAGLGGFFGGVALLIAAVGLYGLVANVVSARTREIGLRVALGATPRRVVALVMGGAGRPAIIGLVIGLIGATALARVLAGLLVGLSPYDPVTFCAVPAVLGIIVVMASYLPARRATRLDPVSALRE